MRYSNSIIEWQSGTVHPITTYFGVQSMAATLLRKISPATIFDKLPRLDVEGAPKEFPLYSVYGVASKVRTGKTDKGDWVSFKGQFEAVTSNGEIFMSGQCFLPQPFEDMLFSQLQAAQQADEKASVEFAVRVFLVPPKAGKPSATGYEYRCEPLIEATESSPVLSLRAKVLEKMKLLAAPTEETSAANTTPTAGTAPAAGARRR